MAAAAVNPPLIVVIDDEPQIQRLLKLTLEAAGYRTRVADAGQAGLVEVAASRPDAVVLDLGLPDVDGLEVLRRLREWSTVPVLMLSVRDDEAGKVAALDLGADDYVTKPFSSSELLARLRAITRRVVNAAEAPVLRFGELELDLAARRVTVAGAEVHLTATEYSLLRLLAMNAGKVVTQRQILREVWGPNAEERAEYLRVFMTHLRKKVDPGGSGLIRTEPRIGYRLAG
jgi:two-component system KDP operon response regulator KdpE